jgi:hypothetical protein
VTRNVKEATVRVYRLNAQAYFEQRGSLAGIEDIEVALVKSDRTIALSPKSWTPYRRDTMKLELELKEGETLPEGAYLVAVEAAERRSVVPVVVSRVRLLVKQAPRDV